MFANLSKKEYEKLASGELFDACFKPLIQDYKNRMGKQPVNRVQEMEYFYQTLTTGQKALFVIHMYYDHAIESLVEYYWWSCYFYAQPRIWSAIKNGLDYFGDVSWFAILEETENLFKTNDYPRTLENFSVIREDLERDPELSESMRRLFDRFVEESIAGVERISHFIRNQPSDFVMIKNEKEQ